MVQQFTICGAGIAGLYSAYKILKNNPHALVTIFEKNKYIGGRMHVASFAGVDVPIGAGIGRKEKDNLLLELLDTFKLKYHEGIIGTNHIGHSEIDLKEVVNKLRSAYTKNPYHEPFKKFALRHMPLEDYNNFITNTGYSDFNKTDAYDVLYNYGVEDLFSGWKSFGLPWNDVIQCLVEFIQQKGGHIKLGYTVHKFKNNVLYIKNKNNLSYKTIHIDNNNTLILATTISTIRSILPSFEIYKDISATPYMRVYGQFTSDCRGLIANRVSKTTILNKPLQEIIPINPNEGVYMIIYNDNGSALQLYKKLSELNNSSTAITSNNLGPYVPKYNQKCISYIETLLATALELPRYNIKLNKIVVYFWREGTHYFRPLPKKYANRNDFIHEAQRPSRNVYVVGEAVAQHQGWTEGALQSVVNIIDEL